MPAGRPTGYRKEYCEEIVKLANTGMHMYRIAATWGVSYDAINEWSHFYEEFHQAYARAKTIQAANMMDKVIDGMTNRNFNAQSAHIVVTQFIKMAKEREIALEINGESLAEKAASIIDNLKKPVMSAVEFNQIMSGIATAAKIDEVTDLRDKLEMLESQEEK